MTYSEKLHSRIKNTGSGLCVGLDVRAGSAAEARSFITEVVAETAPYAAAFKPNAAYFEALGWQGVKLLEELRSMIPSDIPIILDVKRGGCARSRTGGGGSCSRGPTSSQSGSSSSSEPPSS